MRLCNRTRKLLGLWWLLSGIGGDLWLVADAAPDCDLQCQNGGFCDDGPPLPSTMGNYLGTSSSVDPAQILMELQAEDARFLTHHCVCPTGYTGPYCQDSTSVVVHCRDHSHCLNGGTCNTQNGFCNCRVTVQDMSNGVQHVGRHCEHTVATRFGPQQCNNTATTANNNEPTYCANGGMCNQESYVCVCVLSIAAIFFLTRVDCHFLVNLFCSRGVSLCIVAIVILVATGGVIVLPIMWVCVVNTTATT